MKTTKFTVSTLSFAALAFVFSACGNQASNSATAANAANKSNTAAVANSNQTTTNNAVNVSNAKTETAQSNAETTAPNVIVKELYAAHEKATSQFFGSKDAVLFDKYFRKDLADAIRKDIRDAKGEVGAIDFDPLYGSQDPQIKNFVIMETGWGGDKKFGGENDAVVQVTFKDSGQEVMISYQFERGADKSWKIYDIHYRRDGSETKLSELLNVPARK